ncbi:hypothetical protein FQR65_LT06968 [Abscondita terminalis]|nr:hypothetical protein FQR65_LT06968 [Abscondita terminalis]
MIYIKIVWLLLHLCFGLVQSARILGIMYMPSFSHQIVLRPLWKELSLKGHQVTVLTTDPINDPHLTNLTEIDLKESYILWGNLSLFHLIDIPAWRVWQSFMQFSDQLMDIQLQNPKVQKLINNPNEHFDLLIIEGFQSAHYAFSHKFKCPFISVLTLDATAVLHHEIGNPTHYALYPDYTLPFAEPLTFYQQLESLHYNLYVRYTNYYYLLPSQQRLVEKHFGKHYPPIQEIYKNYSIFFLNTNSVLHPIRPLLPNVVQIWGKNHITKSSPLPTDLEKVLNESSNGVIYFSLGSNVKSKYISSDIMQAIISVFKELPYTTLWKFEDEHLPNKPDNVIISKWFPQQDILKHRNIKLFITQGGLQSFEEALEAKVPLLGIPVLGDQKSNVLRIANKD